MSGTGERITPARIDKIRTHLDRCRVENDHTFGDLAARDLLAELDRLHTDLAPRIDRWEQEAQHHSEYDAKVGAPYERGKAAIYDALATEVRSVLATAAPVIAASLERGELA